MKTIFTFISLTLFLTIFDQKGKNFHCHWRAGGADISTMADDSYEFFKKGNFCCRS